jgi:PTH1 family peptidyl-tRNA hydrolase
MKLIAGLGNPGKTYRKTRHNIGFVVIDELAGALARELSFGDVEWKSERDALFARAKYAGQSLLLVKPQTFINNSGNAVSAIARFYKIKAQDIWVVYDDIDLPLGELRIRERGSSGGHNGVESIIDALGTNEFPRFRLGTGPVPARIDPADFVLQNFAPEELGVAAKLRATTVSAIIAALEKVVSGVM